ncbi:PDZ domain-containing protein [Stenotrophomonas sp. Sa5BUN4]|jgi:hypothetical protein|uniref:PDZ domain-containing protein n=1 Tax=Stenotrophomonas lacuserhaii TaxID=2760084 RepID=A0A8X8FN45_9GAMM|nr:PDZ domain-containing protein [Stenotrophomonas pennii]MBD7952681.1 PDZ domain-containing protein [Stenotrophomonas pennii]
MKTLGSLAVIAGIIALLVSCTMDVSVPTDSGTRVNNIGLMHQQNMLLMTGFGLVLIGFLMRYAGRPRAPGIAVPPPEKGLSAEEVKDLDVLLAGRARTGIVLSSHDAKVVHSVREGSTAAAAGILSGDRLVQIDGEFVGNDLRGNTIRLSGDPGTFVSLTLRRGDRAVSAEVLRELQSDEDVSLGAIARTDDVVEGHGSIDKPSEGFGTWVLVLTVVAGLFLLFYRLSR